MPTAKPKTSLTPRPKPRWGHAVLLLGKGKSGKTYVSTKLSEAPHVPWKLWNTDRPDGAAGVAVPAGCKLSDLTNALSADPGALEAALDRELALPQLSYATYILDSISFFVNYGVLMPKLIEAGSFQKVGRAGWGDVYIDATVVVMKLRALQSRGANIVVTCHVSERDDPKTRSETDPSNKLTWQENALPGKAHAQLGANFTLVGHLMVEPAASRLERPEYFMYTAPVGRIEAGCSYGHVVDPKTKKPVIPVEWKSPTMDGILAALDRAREIQAGYQPPAGGEEETT